MKAMTNDECGMTNASKFVIQVLERRGDGNLWPLATVNVFSGGKSTFTGDPRVAFGPLLSATKKATSLMVLKHMHEALSAKQSVQEQIVNEGGAA